jgi:hypothetical protein
MNDNTFEWLCDFIKRDKSIQLVSVTEDEFTISLKEATLTVSRDRSTSFIEFRETESGTQSGFFEPKRTATGLKLFLEGEGDGLRIDAAAQHLIGLLKQYQQAS